MINLIGQKFGRLTVQELAGRDGKHLMWNCVCDCGNSKRVQGNSLRSGHTKSCGCFNKEQIKKSNTTHGYTKHNKQSREYVCWQSMISRCEKPHARGYNRYGARGIKVCEEWHKFENFIRDMGNCPQNKTLDRTDNNGGYRPDNCRWATSEEQNNNRRDNRFIDYKGERKTLSQWARKLDINVMTLKSRLNKYHWSEEKALTTPIRRRKKNEIL